MHAYWRDARDLSDRGVLAEVAVGVGLSAAAFLAALDEAEYAEVVQADIDFAHQHGLNSVPALVFAEQYLVSGAQPVEVLRQVVAKIAVE